MVARPRILLHACCAVCMESVIDVLISEGWDVTVFFYNPNIHPYQEFEKRLRAIEVACEARKVPLVADKNYGLALYLAEILSAGSGRCGACYALRLGMTARFARGGAAGGEGAHAAFDAFTSTLLTSSHQDHAAVKEAGEAAGAATGARFIYGDWRDRLAIGIERAKKRSLYRQRYCGCIMSEYERFGPRKPRAGE